MRLADADVYNQRSTSFFTGQLAWFARGLGRAFTFSVGSDYNAYPDCRGLLPAPMAALYRWGIARADAVIAQTEEQKRLMEKHFKRQIALIRNGIPIPDSSRPAALELATRLGVPYREGFVKNRYIGRTFIMPGQASRRKSVRQKLNAITSEFRGKNVLLVDDSIVRGTTSREIIQMAREAGAKKVYFASASPPVRHANVYGIDMPSRTELIAAFRNDEEIRQEIGADALIYQDLEAMKNAVREINPALTQFDTSCFDGHYITGDVSADYLSSIEEARSRPSRDDGEGGQLDLNLVTNE